MPYKITVLGENRLNAMLSPMKTPRPPRWLHRLDADYHFRNLFLSYLGVHCYFVQAPGYTDWWQLFRGRDEESPVHYEFLFGRWEDRGRYNRQHMDRVRREGKTVVSQRMGFHDIFTPVMDGGKVWGILVAGAVYNHAPTYEDLSQQWKDVTGSHPVGYHADFARFARLCLRRPVLEGESFQAFVEVMELFAQWLTARGGEEKIGERLVKLRDQVFSKIIPHEFWMSWALGENPAAPTPWFGRSDAGRWEKSEIGIDRIPNTVLAVSLEDPPSVHADPVRGMLQGRDLHQECFRFAQELEHAAGGRFHAATAALLTAPKKGSNATQARLELRDLARRLQDHLTHRFRRPVRIGVGRAVPTGDSLRPSAEEAQAALQMALHFRKPLVFYGDPGVRAEEVNFAQVQSLSKRLESAVARRESGEAAAARDRYVRSAVLHFGENREGIRVHALTTLMNLVDSVGKLLPAAPDAVERLRVDWGDRMERAGSMAAIWDSFREGCEALGTLSLKPAEGGRRLRLEQALEDVRIRWAESVTAAQVARRWGFAPSDFSRLVKRVTGRSFPAYREALRIDHAKRLLKTSALPASQVAVECGFRTAAYFGRVFKRAVGVTPDRYRQAG